MFKNLVGEKFGRLTVIRRQGSRLVGTNGKFRAAWLCRCICGREITSVTITLTTGHTKSCGCIRKEHPNAMRHGHAKNGQRSKAFQTWIGIKSRCLNPKEIAYKHYGARGITVCDRWLESFDNFLADMGEPTVVSLQLDRIDNNAGYSKDNCRWTTSVINGRNRSITLRVEGQTLGEIVDKYGVDYHRLYHQLITRNNSLSYTIAKLTAQNITA